MAIGVLLIVAAGLGVYGYFRGAARLLLALLPLGLASLLLWLFGPLFYRIDALRSVGLAWPTLMLVLTGLAAGYALQFGVRKKLPSKIHRADRVGGAVTGVSFALLIVWLGCVYVAVWSASRQGATSRGSAEKLARVLDATILRWIPAVGSGSTAMMELLEISTAEEQVRRQALQELGFDRLLDLPQMRAVQQNAETRKDIEAAAQGSILALWRLQKDPRILELVETEEVRAALAGHSLNEIAEAVRELKRNADENR